MSDNQPQVRTCPNCGGSLVNTSHGPYCPNQHCKWGWEVELDGSPLKPPLPQPTPAEPWIETVPDERAAWRKWFISEYGFPSSKLDDVSWEAWRARAGSSLIAEPPECGALLSVPGYAGLMRTVSMETASRFDSGDIPLVYFSGISLEIYQQDWSPGWASFLEDGSIAEGAKAHATLNLGSCLVAVESGELPAKDLPYLIAESIMHEAIHALESWAKVEFSEERVEGLIEVYRKKYRPDDEKHWHSDPTLERDNSNQFASPPSSPGAAQTVKKLCGHEFKLKDGYFCELPHGHAGGHEATCPNPQFHQSWPNETADMCNKCQDEHEGFLDECECKCHRSPGAPQEQK